MQRLLHLWQFQPFFRSQRFFQAHSLHHRLYLLGTSWGYACPPSSASTLPIFHIKPEYSKPRKKKSLSFIPRGHENFFGFFLLFILLLHRALCELFCLQKKKVFPPYVCFCFMRSKNRAAGIKKAKGGNDSPLLYEHHDKHIPPHKWFCKLEHEVKLCFSIDRVASV